MTPEASPAAAASVARLVQEGADMLPRRRGLTDPAREASWLLAAALDVTETWLRIHPESVVPTAIERRYRSWVEQRAAGAPAEHLVGSCRFWGRDFLVSPEVLIPRPETEFMIEAALELPSAGRARVLDVGTGSGCVAVTLAAERPGWRVAGVDRSLGALRIARDNAARHQVRVAWLEGDLGASVRGPFDVVTANLPYLPTDWLDHLPVEVHREPRLALDGGADGLVLVRCLLADLRRFASPGGWCLIELAEGQADMLQPEYPALGLHEVRRARDAGGCDRLVVLRCGG